MITYTKTRRIKYRLNEPYIVNIAAFLRPEHEIRRSYGVLTVDGDLSIRRGYSWDGPSGPTIDTGTFMRGSLVHDFLYQLLREGVFDDVTVTIQPNVLPQSLCSDVNKVTVSPEDAHGEFRSDNGSSVLIVSQTHRDRVRAVADYILRAHCKEDGMSRFRAAYVYSSVRMFGKNSATADSEAEVLTASK